MYRTALSDNNFDQFIRRHSKLTKLSIEQTNIGISALRMIGQNLRKLQELKFVESYNSSRYHTNAVEAKYIAQLNALSKIEIDLGWSTTDPVVSALCNGNVPIEPGGIPSPYNNKIVRTLSADLYSNHL